MTKLEGMRISYEDMANPYKEGRILRVETPTTPSGIELPAIAWIAWEEEDRTIRLSSMGAAQLQRLLRRGNDRVSMGLRIVEEV